MGAEQTGKEALTQREAGEGAGEGGPPPTPPPCLAVASTTCLGARETFFLLFPSSSHLLWAHIRQLCNPRNRFFLKFKVKLDLAQQETG